MMAHIQIYHQFAKNWPKGQKVNITTMILIPASYFAKITAFFLQKQLSNNNSLVQETDSICCEVHSKLPTFMVDGEIIKVSTQSK